MTIDEAMRVGIAHHQAGRLLEARAIYHQVLSQRPGDADAQHLLGVIAQQLGELDASVDFIRRAIEANPGTAEYYYNLGNTLFQMERFAEACAAYREALRLKPRYADAFYNLGNALANMGAVDEGIKACLLYTSDGYVKWNVVQSEEGVRDSLRRYVGLINAVSPGNHADLFATSNDRLAYWINAYNAMCVYAVFEHDYPGTMLAGRPPGAIFSTERFMFGGRPMTLDGLVKEEIEPTEDPRLFFALSFCAASGPPLRATPYDGAVLEAELLDQGQRYLSDPRAAVRDGDSVKLNDLLLTMHKADFLAGFQKMMGVAPTGILQALQPFVQSDSPIVGATKVENLGFDWSLNRPPR